MSLSSLVNDLAARLATEFNSVRSAIAGKADSARKITAGTGLTGGGDLTADRTLAVAYGTTAGTAAQGNDSRLSNARTPTAHAASHASGGTDPITPASIGAQPAGSYASTADLAGYQPLDADLTTIAGLSPTNGQLLRRVAGAWVASSLTAADVGAVPTTRTVSAGAGLTGGGDLSADRTLAVAYGTTAGTAAQGNDARLSDARTPLAHTHAATDVASGTLAIARIPTGTTSSTVALGNHTHTPASIGAAAASHTHDYPDLPAGLPRGRVASNVNTTQVTGISTTETVTDSLSFTAVAGRRYRLTWNAGWFATAGDQYYVTFRYRAGSATLLGTSTQFHRRMLGVAANNNRTALVMVDDVTGIPAGTTAIGVTVVRATGAGTFTRDGSADTESVLILDDVGV